MEVIKLLLLYATVAFAAYKTDCGGTNKRYCQSGYFFSPYTYKFFTGANPKSEFAVAFKETMTNSQTYIFDQAAATSSYNPRPVKYDQFSYNTPATLSGSNFQFPYSSSGSQTISVARIRRIWQFPNPKSSYDDTAGGLAPTDIWWQNLYNWPAQDATKNPHGLGYTLPVSTLGSYHQDWFMGDIVPFRSCAYVFRMVSQGTGTSFTKWYTVEQLLFQVTFDTTHQFRHAMVSQGNIQTFKIVGAQTNNFDLPYDNEVISYYPHWCSFYWATQGRLIVKTDTTCQSAWANDPANSPCNTKPLFPDATSMAHYDYSIGSSGTFIDQVFVYGFMYFSVTGNNERIYKAYKSSSTNGILTVQLHWYLRDLQTRWSPALVPVIYPVYQMASLDGYGYYINMPQTFTQDMIWQYVINLKKDAVTGVKLTDANGNFIESPANTAVNTGLDNPLQINKLQIDTSSKFNMKLYQTKFDYVDSRPLYQAWGGGTSNDFTTNRNKLNLVSSVTTLYMTVNQVAQNGDLRSLDFYNYDLVVNSNQMFLVMPGTNINDIGNSASIDYTKTKVAIFDVISKDEVMRWQLGECGDGVVNRTAFEVCDYAATTQDPAQTGYVYPDTTTYPFSKVPSSLKIFYWPSAVSANNNLGYPLATTSPNGGIKYPTRYGTNNYFICDTNCQPIPINTCGDGVQSNGPLNTDGREVCDDGNQVSGDGCSSDCKTIETGWECPVWGKPCRLLCGNGVLDPPYTRKNPITGALETFTEECDLGNPLNDASTGQTNFVNYYHPPGSWTQVHYNKDFGTGTKNDDAFNENDAYLNACSATCRVSSHYYWQCNANTATSSSKPASNCAYLCGNRWLDQIGQTATARTANYNLTEQCDLLVQPYSAQTRTGWLYNTNLANVNLMTSPAPGTTVPQAWLTTASYFTGGSSSQTPNTAWITLTDPYVNYVKNQAGDYFYTGTALFSGSTPVAVYDQSNIGCDLYCKVKANFVCPNANTFYDIDYAGNTITQQYTYATWDSNMPLIQWNGPQLRCSDRIQDGVYDGPYKEILRFLQTQSVKQKSWMWNSFILYSSWPVIGQYSAPYGWQGINDDLDTNDRLWPEQCDNAGDTAHGCDALGRIVSGWICRHYYVAIRDAEMLAQTEVPWFRSLCKQTGTHSPAWRILFGEDESGYTSKGRITHDEAIKFFPLDDDDEWGESEAVAADNPKRVLNHTPNRAYKAILPTNSNEFRNFALYQNAQTASMSTMNGQIRLAELQDTNLNQAIIFGYPLGVTTAFDNMFIYYNTASCPALTAGAVTPTSFGYPGIPAQCTGGIQTLANNLAAGSLINKQRNTFGPYIVSNAGLQTLKWQGFKTGSGYVTNIYTTSQVANIEFLGNHELYCWGYLGILLARLSDGATFQIFRFSSTFDTVAAAAASTESATTIFQTAMKLQFVVPGKVIVPPVFVNDIAVFYYKNAANQGFLLFYKWSTYTNSMELQKTVTVTGDTSAPANYQKYSLVRVATGVIFKVAGATAFKFYKTSDYTYTESAVTWSAGTATVGTASAAAQQLLQPRDNPKSFSSTVIPTIFAYQNNNYMYQMTWDEAAKTLTVTTSTPIPCSSGLTYPANVLCYDPLIILEPQWIDVGYLSFVVFSPINCAAKKGVTTITGMSARFFLLSTTPDVDTNNDGLVDGTGTFVSGVCTGGTATCTAVNYHKGWTCWDLPNYNAGTSSSITKFETSVNHASPTWTY